MRVTEEPLRAAVVVAAAEQEPVAVEPLVVEEVSDARPSRTAAPDAFDADAGGSDEGEDDVILVTAVAAPRRNETAAAAAVHGDAAR